MTVTTAPDIAAIEAFAGKTFGDITSTFTTLLAAVGDRLGFYKTLARLGPMTSSELASATSTNEHYTREWLNGAASAGHLTYDGATGTFTLPEPHAAVLADEDGPAFMGGFIQQVPAAIAVYEQVIAACQHGGGVPQSAYGAQFWEGMQRDSAVTMRHSLVQAWLPLAPDVRERLEQGATVADIGCGSGQALIRLAEAFPTARFTGYDVFPEQVALATANVAAAGYADRIRIVELDATNGLPQSFDVITSFEVVHDAIDPAALLAGVRRSLNPGGVYLMVEPGAGDTLEENLGPIGTMIYASSLFYCMQVSLAEGGEGLGTAGLPESRIRELAITAGFRSVRNAGIEHPLLALYELHA